jgi:hypothetical protein
VKMNSVYFIMGYKWTPGTYLGTIFFKLSLNPVISHIYRREYLQWKLCLFLIVLTQAKRSFIHWGQIDPPLGKINFFAGEWRRLIYDDSCRNCYLKMWQEFESSTLHPDLTPIEYRLFLNREWKKCGLWFWHILKKRIDVN